MLKPTTRILGDYYEYGYGNTKIAVSLCVENGEVYVRMTRFAPQRTPRSFAIPHVRVAELLQLLNREDKKGCFLEYGYGHTLIEVFPIDVNGVPYVRIARDHPNKKLRSFAVPVDTVDELISLLNIAKEAA